MELLPGVETPSSRGSLQVSLLLPDLTCLLMFLHWAAQGCAINLHPAPYSCQLRRLRISVRRVYSVETIFSGLRSKQYCHSFSKDIIIPTKASVPSRGSIPSSALNTKPAQTVRLSELSPFSFHSNTLLQDITPTALQGMETL